MNNLFPWQKTNSHIFFLTCHKMVFLLSYCATKKGWFMFLLQHFKQLDLFFYFLVFIFTKKKLLTKILYYIHLLQFMTCSHSLSYNSFFLHIFRDIFINFYYKIWFIFPRQNWILSCLLLLLFFFYSTLIMKNYMFYEFLIHNLIIFTFHFIKFYMKNWLLIGGEWIKFIRN